MRPINLIELLAVHADALSRGDDLTDIFVETYGAQMPELPALLYVARRVARHLVPLAAPESYSDALRQNLIGLDDNDVPRFAFLHGRSFWVGAALVGSAVSMAGISLLYWRFSRPPEHESGGIQAPG